MRHRSFVVVVAVAMLLAACSTTGSGSGLSPAAFELAQNAVFEVVQLKPVDDTTVYERELDWSTVPFAIRNDQYNSIGTAFAISSTELITAFHVINLGFESMVYNQYHVRNRAGEVFEVDQIVGGSNEKDFLIFTVKDKTFDTYFEFERRFREGQQVFSVGNALGEGIVIRDGLVLGTTPEADSGRWNLLKTSASGNPGNSGGPLVTPAGKVVALVTARQDNILYSLPSSVILDTSRSKLNYRLMMGYGHLILANRATKIFETELALPQPYKSVRERLTAEYQVFYDATMSGLFVDAPEYLTGPSNMWILNATITTVFPQIDFVDPNDNEWTLSNVSPRSYNLTDDGILMHIEISDWNFYKLNKPKPVSLVRSYEPKYIMDTILQNIRLERTLGNDKYRMLSFGDPGAVSTYTDFLGRTWLTSQWLIEFADQVLVMYVLPLPNGPAVVTVRKASSMRNVYEWDLRKICDHLWASYNGTFAGWGEFLATRHVPDFLKNLNYRWQESAKQISFNTGDIAFSANSSVYDWTSNSELFLGPSHYLNDQVRFGIRRITLSLDSRQKESISVVKRLKPDQRMPNNAQENWNDVYQERFPYNGIPAISAKDNQGTIGAVLLPPSQNPNLRYALYLSMENPRNEDNVQSRFNAFKNGVRIRD
ncbi:MAG: serine protease [Treponema sp.]|jgi:hypothetical protein|nr:serine protease [Treponema sp.]